ncbi:hypothetical protein [Geodermatophilus sp. CPCC 205506]|uniref:hypothetical protein n=1 Tax=Geodermatophilus sp. CPCC 205506 TaxID=2936596 RepID=UPI003EEAA0CC
MGPALFGVGGGALAAWVALVDRQDGWPAVAVIAASSAVSGVGLAIGGASMNSLVPQLAT